MPIVFDEELEVLISRYESGDRNLIEILEFINGKIHDIYLHINNLERKLNKVK